MCSSCITCYPYESNISLVVKKIDLNVFWMVFGQMRRHHPRNDRK